MIDLDAALAELRERHRRIVTFDADDGTFYETSGGERRPVRIESPFQEADAKNPLRNLIPYLRSNTAYESRLTPADRDLRQIIVEQVDDAVCQQLAEEGHMGPGHGGYHPLHMGVCHMFWGTKKRILKEKYNIDWASPQDENPRILFD